MMARAANEWMCPSQKHTWQKIVLELDWDSNWDKESLFLFVNSQCSAGATGVPANVEIAEVGGRIRELTGGVLNQPSQFNLPTCFSAHSRLRGDNPMRAMLASGFRHMYMFTWAEQERDDDNEAESGEQRPTQVQIGNVWLDGH